MSNGLAIDFLNLGIGSVRTGIFNLADVLIIAGVVIFVLFGPNDRKKPTAA
jgi:signal peptidase II